MKPVSHMSGIEKAAALMVALGPNVASESMRPLDEASVQKIAEEIAKIDRLSVEDKEELIGEFLLELKKKKGVAYGGEYVARDLLVAAFGEEKSDEILNNLSKKDLEKGFSFLVDIDTEVLVSFLQDEHPQTIAVTLAHIPPKKAAEILKAIGPEKAKEAARRLATMDRTSPEAVLEISRVLRKKYDKFRMSGSELEATGGVDALVSIMNYMSGDQERALMDYFEHSLPDGSRVIRDKIFTFDHILNLDNREVQRLIEEVADDGLIARALKGAGDQLRIKFFRNMSRNRASDILSDIDAMGPMRISEIQSARDMIVAVMKDLNDMGLITVKKEREEYIE